jgi:hypothetical protein
LDVGETNVGMEIVLEDLAVETARREIAEAEVDYLRTRLEETVTELESCKQKYDELKTQLEPLRRSVAAHKRHAFNTRGRNNGNSDADDAGEDALSDAADRLVVKFVEEAHGCHSESKLLEKMLSHRLMRSLASDCMEDMYQGCSKLAIIERLKLAISDLKYRTSSTHHWHAYSAILAAVAPESGDDVALKKFASDLGCSVKSMAKAMQRRALVDGDEEGGLWYQENKAAYRNSFQQQHSELIPTVIGWHVNSSQPSANKKNLVWKHKGGMVWHKDMGTPGVCEEKGCESHVKHHRYLTPTMRATICFVWRIQIFQNFVGSKFGGPSNLTM